MKDLTVGRIVHYIPHPQLVANPFGVQWETDRHYAAMIVKVLDKDHGTVFLAVFSEDGIDTPGLSHETVHSDTGRLSGIPYSVFEPLAGHWHWPRSCKL